MLYANDDETKYIRERWGEDKSTRRTQNTLSDTCSVEWDGRMCSSVDLGLRERDVQEIVF